jgi:cytochrome b561
MFKNTTTTYGTVNKFLHWSIGLLIIAMVAVGMYMTSMEGSDQKWYIYGLHKSFGIVVLVLVFARVLWRLVNITPDLPASMPDWQKKASKLTHYALYLIMVVYPVSGFLMSVMAGRYIEVFGMFTIPFFTEEKTATASAAHWMHVNLTYVAIGLISFHVFAALYHHFFVKDDVLRRMI